MLDNRESAGVFGKIMSNIPVAILFSSLILNSGNVVVVVDAIDSFAL
jgi:hypothetical protein